MPKVLNKHHDLIPPDAIYVGRPSKWGNPYRIGQDGSREQVIRLYRLALIASQVDLSELQGKDLVCWCAPSPCHADILLELANKSL